jgi:hypothetical protein
MNLYSECWCCMGQGGQCDRCDGSGMLEATAADIASAHPKCGTCVNMNYQMPDNMGHCRIIRAIVNPETGFCNLHSAIEVKP